MVVDGRVKPKKHTGGKVHVGPRFGVKTNRAVGCLFLSGYHDSSTCRVCKTMKTAKKYMCNTPKDAVEKSYLVRHARIPIVFRYHD